MTTNSYARRKPQPISNLKYFIIIIFLLKFVQTHDDGKHMMIRGDDGEMREMEIVATRDKLSAYQIACPILPIPMAIICGVLNIIPGEELFSLL